MLLPVIVLVLRETLEASLLISVLLSISRIYDVSNRWLAVGFLSGMCFAVIYALNLSALSESFEYMGQEVYNAFAMFLITGLLFCLCVMLSFSVSFKRLLIIVMAITVAFAISREGGELFVFYSGFIITDQNFVYAATSGFIGMAIGFSAGALLYYSLIMAAEYKVLKLIQIFFITLIASGMSLQAVQLLIQADWLPDIGTAWDSSFILPESSILGQIAYALFGYESTPTWLEIIAYGIALSLMLITFALSLFKKSVRNTYVAAH